MLSQDDLERPRSLKVVERSEHEGDLKTHDPEDDPEQRKTFTNRGDEYSPFSIDVSMITCVHGVLGSDDPTAASLIVLQFEILSGDGYVVKGVKTSMRFEIKGVKPAKMPSVEAYAPCIQRKYHETTEDVNKKKGWEAGGGADVAPAKLDAKYNQETEVGHTQVYFEKLEAQRQHIDKTDVYDKVWWRLSQNKNQNTGTTVAFQTAILLTRTDKTSKFLGHFAIDIDGGPGYNLGQKLDKWLGKAVVDDPVTFNPAKAPFGVGNLAIVVESDKLGDYRQGKALDKRLGRVWGVDWTEWSK